MCPVIELRPQGTPADLMARTRLWLQAEGHDSTPLRRLTAWEKLRVSAGEPLKLTSAEVVRIRDIGGPK